MPSLCGKLIHGRWLPDPAVISIHPPRVGWDLGVVPAALQAALFQSTHPVWGGTTVLFDMGLPAPISIHPPRVGWDPSSIDGSIVYRKFQSTHPVWGGTVAGYSCSTSLVFQSTHPVWGGTGILFGSQRRARFQSTHPVWGGTKVPEQIGGSAEYFNPPTPCGVGR